jgi:hypothetical protein
VSQSSTNIILEYADVVWDTKTQILINKLENVEVEAARIVTGGTVPDLYP